MGMFDPGGLADLFLGGVVLKNQEKRIAVITTLAQTLEVPVEEAQEILNIWEGKKMTNKEKRMLAIETIAQMLGVSEEIVIKRLGGDIVHIALSIEEDEKNPDSFNKKFIAKIAEQMEADEKNE